MRTPQGLLLLALLHIGFLSKATTIELWHQRPESTQFWSEIITEFQLTHPDIQVKVSEIPSNELKLAIVRTVFQNNAPDIVLAPSDYIGKYQQMKLSPIPADYISKELHPHFSATTQINGQNYGIPLMGSNHLVLYYNKKLAPTAAKTWRELIEQQTELTQQKVNTMALKYNEMYWFSSFITAYDGFPVDGNKITLNTQAVVDALIFYKGLVLQKLVSADCNNDCVARDFYAEKYAYSINGAWAYKEAKQHLGEHFALSSLPKIGNRIMRPLFSSLALLFPNQVLDSKKAIAIKQFSDFLQSEKIQQQLYDVTGLMPSHAKIIQNIKRNADANRKALLEQLEMAVAMPPSQAMSAAWVGMSQGFKLFINNKIEAQKAAKLMQKIAQRELKKMRFEP